MFMATWLDFVFFTLRVIDFVILKTITEIKELKYMFMDILYLHFFYL